MWIREVLGGKRLTDLGLTGLVVLSLSVSNSLWPHGLQHTRLPCSPSPGVCSNSCPLSQWCQTTISSSVVPFSSCLQSFPVSGSFLKSQLFTSGGQSIGASASASVLQMNVQGWFPLGWTGLISLLSKGLSRVFSNSTVQKHQFFGAQPSLWSLFLCWGSIFSQIGKILGEGSVEAVCTRDFVYINIMFLSVATDCSEDIVI